VCVPRTTTLSPLRIFASATAGSAQSNMPAARQAVTERLKGAQGTGLNGGASSPSTTLSAWRSARARTRTAGRRAI
jgi:hypothetical protein